MPVDRRVHRLASALQLPRRALRQPDDRRQVLPGWNDLRTRPQHPAASSARWQRGFRRKAMARHGGQGCRGLPPDQSRWRSRVPRQSRRRSALHVPRHGHHPRHDGDDRRAHAREPDLPSLLQLERGAGNHGPRPQGLRQRGGVPAGDLGTHAARRGPARLRHALRPARAGHPRRRDGHRRPPASTRRRRLRPHLRGRRYGSAVSRAGAPPAVGQGALRRDRPTGRAVVHRQYPIRDRQAR